MRTFLRWNKQSYEMLTVVQRQLTWRWKVRFRCNIVAIRYLWCFPCPVQLWTALDVCLFVLLIVKWCEAADCLVMWCDDSAVWSTTSFVVKCLMVHKTSSLPAHKTTTLYALCMHVSFMRLRIFRTFQESVRIAYYFHINRRLQRQL